MVKLIELVTKLEIGQPEVLEICRIFGLSIDEKSNITSHSTVFNRELNVEQLVSSVIREAKKIEKESGKPAALVDTARAMAEAYKFQQEQAKQAEKNSGDKFDLDTYFEQTFGIAPDQLLPGTSEYLAYCAMQKYVGFGASLVAAAYGYALAEADAIMQGQMQGQDAKKNPQQSATELRELELIEETISKGAERGASRVFKSMQGALAKIHALAIAPTSETASSALPLSQHRAMPQQSINGLPPS